MTMWVTGLAACFAAAAAALCTAPCSAMPAAEIGAQPLPVTPVLLFERDRRETADQFAAEQKTDAAQVRDRHAASGLLMCGHAHGAAQLTEADDVITTAAHVIFDRDGKPREPVCVFYYERGRVGLSRLVDVSSVVAGTHDPYNADATRDWAVARLQSPAVGVTPYRLAASAGDDGPVELVARGHMDFGAGIATAYEACRMHGVVGRAPDGTRNLAIDCGTGEGSSGGALLTQGSPGELCGVLVGFRTIAPDHNGAFSMQNYNFVVSLEGAFREAILAAARRSLPGQIVAGP